MVPENRELRGRIDELLADVPSEGWKHRILASLQAIELLFRLTLQRSEVVRSSLDPAEIWVSALDELDIPQAAGVLREHGTGMPPVTVLLIRGRHYLFMGSLRALAYALAGRRVDSIIADVSRAGRLASMVTEASLTLGTVLSRSKPYAK